MGWQDIKGAWNNFMQSPEAMGGPTSTIDYGARKLAEWAHRNTGGSSQNNNWYDNADARGWGNYNYYDSALPYNENLTNENYGKSLASSVGHMDVNKLMNRRLPSNLTRDMGASTYQAPPPATVYPGQRNIHEGFGTADVSSTFPPPEKRGIMQNIKNWGGNILDNTIMGKIAGGLNPTNPRSGNFNPMLEGQLENYQAQGFRVNEQGQAIDGPLAGKNLVSGFGTNDVTQMLRDRLQKIRTRKIAQTTSSRNKQRDILAAIQAQTAAENRGYQGTPRGNTGSGAFARFDNTTKDYGPHSKGGGQGGNQGGNYGAAQGTPGSWNPGARKDGGRIGYRNGEFVDEDINIQGPGFDVNENIEMAEGKSPFDLRIDELMDTGMSWQEAYEIAKEEFGQIAEGQEDSFSDQGLASLV